ncbi:hypothetical protein PENSPDRAFT_230202 [Peniophora sp. CONT]|nr:hypothetical protein PENSPDRAFT_230202 [Peniophora sp. CONT]
MSAISGAHITPGSAEVKTGNSPSPLHALIIGIDKYRSDNIDDLKGAVSDADAVRDYLRAELNVPDHQIVNLRDEDATREAIIRGVRAFSEWRTIRKGDPIVIYFAGHGSTSDAPEGWHVGSQKISLIVPHDASGYLDDDPEDLVKHAIPDRTFGALLHDLAEGDNGISDNITVIFDCCHSGSGTRGTFKGTSLRPRGVNSRRIPAHLDEPIWSSVPRSRGLCVAAGFAHAGSRSHVLLAACRETELAYEGDDRGVFTQKLIATLKALPTDKTTYRGLMERIPNIPNQIPQCEGYNADRILFNALVPCEGRKLYNARLDGSTGIVVDAGSIHGVTSTSEFAFYRLCDPQATDRPLAALTPENADKVHAFTTDLPPHPSLSPEMQPYCAALSSMGDADALRLHFSSSDKGLDSIKEATEKVVQLQRSSGGPTIVAVEKEADAHLIIHTSGGQATYIVNESLITALALSSPRQTTKADPRSIQAVLSAAVHFFWHLLRSPRMNELSRNISVAMYELKEDDGTLGSDRRRPWVVSNGKNLFEGAFVDVVADDTTPYGIAVRNGFDYPLHVWAFYFDCSTLSIAVYYKPPPIGRGAEPSLPELGQGVLTIGYGAGGGLPYTFSLSREDQELDVGFIKLFISSEYVDLSSIERSSPFDIRARNIKKKPRPPPAAVWDTFIIPVVQRKPLGPHVKQISER